jgi:hypothetical protein
MAKRLKLTETNSVNEAPEWLKKLNPFAKKAATPTATTPAAPATTPAPEPKELNAQDPALIRKAGNLYRELINKDFSGLETDNAGAPLIMGGANRDIDKRMFFAVYADLIESFKGTEEQFFASLLAKVNEKIEKLRTKAAEKETASSSKKKSVKKVDPSRLDSYGQAKLALSRLKKRFSLIEDPRVEPIFKKIAAQVLVAFKDPEVTTINLTEAKSVSIKIRDLYSNPAQSPTEQISKAINDWLDEDVPRYRKIHIQFSEDFGKPPETKLEPASATPTVEPKTVPPAEIKPEETPAVASVEKTAELASGDVKKASEKPAAVVKGPPKKKAPAKKKPATGAANESLYEGLFDKFLDIEKESPEDSPFKQNSKGVFKLTD